MATGVNKQLRRNKVEATFCLGTQRLYDWLHDNGAVELLPVDLVNDPRHIAKNHNVVSVNATLQIDLSGACNSEHVMGRQYSGSGGQLDFVRGAFASQGGKSIIVCPSTAKGGTISRIVPKLDGPVTTTESPPKSYCQTASRICALDSTRRGLRMR